MSVCPEMAALPLGRVVAGVRAFSPSLRVRSARPDGSEDRKEAGEAMGSSLLLHDHQSHLLGRGFIVVRQRRHDGNGQFGGT